jgi:hypothetical protein
LANAAGAAGPIFEDDFESGGLAKWSSSSGLTVQSTIVAAGSHAARATGTGTAAYARRTLDSVQTEIYFRTRFQLISQGRNSVYLLRTYKSASSPLISVFVSSSGKLSTYNNVMGATTGRGTAIAAGTWYELQMRVKINGSSSEVEVWLDGARIGELSKTVSLGRAGVQLVQLGDNVVNRSFDVAYDDVAVCTGGLCPALPDPSPPPTSRVPGANSRVILKTYTHNSSGGVGWSTVKYRPRQFTRGLTIVDQTWGPRVVEDVGTYDNWDVLNTLNASVHRIEKRADWLVIEVNRAVTLAVIWRWSAPVPAWLGSWTKAGNVKISGKVFPTYRKKFPAGSINLGGVYDPSDSPGNSTRDTYWVLLAEEDGLPSPAPVVPGGRSTPAPNETCPAWVHDQYVATGPDGKSYPTWHHLIDPVYWCYHRHEHGTNPVWFSGDKKPLFGYTCGRHGMTEPHQGYKNFVFDSNDGTRWMVTHHFGTAGLGRACNRFHTTDIVVRSIASGEILADLHIMGDFGKAVVNSSGKALTPPTCPDQAVQAAQSHGIRKLPSQADGATMYEPWRVALNSEVFGFIASFTINNPDAMVICNNSTCDQPVVTGATGSKRFFTPNGDARGNRFGIVAGENSGVFYTDVHGTKVVSSSDPQAVPQYIKPGARMQVLHNGTHFYDVHAWGKKFVPNATDGNPTDREGSIQAPN